MCFSNLIKQFSLIAIVAGLTACAGTTDETALGGDSIGFTPENGITDKISPSVPSNLRKSVNNANTDSIKLEWDASTDDTAVIGYIILRDGIVLNKTPDTSFVDSDVSPQTSYIYTIVAYDDANNTASSKSLSVTLSIGSVSTTLSWTPPNQNTDSSALTNLSGYKIYYGLSAGALTNSIDLNTTGLTSFVIEDLAPNTTYYFSISAVNTDKIESSRSNIVSVNVAG